MPLMQINRTPDPPRLITVGQNAKVIDSPPVDKKAETAPPEPVKNTRGRKKMADEKKLDHDTGVEKIKQEDAGTQGAVGSGGVNAPAQEKAPEKPKGDKDNG